MEQKRFIEIGRLENREWIKGCPVNLDTTILERDTLTGNVHLKFIFFNAYKEAVKTVYLNIYCYDDCKDKLGEALEEAVQGRSPEANSRFKTSAPVVIPYKNTSIVKVDIIKILFSDGEVWRYTEDMERLIAPEAVKITEDHELYKQIARECLPNGVEMVCWPQDFHDFWMCSCSHINEGDSCRHCGVEHRWLKEHFDRGYLEDKNREYLEEERKRIEEQQRIIEEQERRIKEEAWEKGYSAGEAFLSKEKLTSSDYLNAASAFKGVSEYKDAVMRAEECEKKAEELKLLALTKRKRILKIAGISIIAVLVLAALTYGSVVYFIPEGKYHLADIFRKKDNYDRAISLYVSLGDYKDSEKQLITTKYERGLYLIEQESYEEAIKQFQELKYYSDSMERRRESHYLYGKKLYDEKDYLKASEEFYNSNGYKDSNKLFKESSYLAGKELYSEGNYIEAGDLFRKAGNYKDSNELQNEAIYKGALEYYKGKDYLNAYRQLAKIRDYKDSSSYYEKSCYIYAEELYSKKDYSNALSFYGRINDYKDSGKKIKACNYFVGCDFLKDRNYANAVDAFEGAKGYEDSDAKLKQAMYGYVTSNESYYDEKTLKYLKTLKASDYKDSRRIYNSLYGWNLSIVANGSESDEQTDLYSISKYSTVYFHVKLSGGEPGETIRLKYTGTWPNGESYSDTWDGSWDDGCTGFCYFWYNNPYYGATGTFTLKVYDSAGNLIGSDSIMLTN